MKKLAYILTGLVCAGLQSCYNDDSSLGGNPIIEIAVGSDAKDSINMYFNDELRINADIQSSTDDLTYEWGIGLYQTENKTVFKTVSDQKDLVYIPRELGHYEIRQMVTSKDGSTMKYYHLFVNSPYEEGFLILGRKENGKGSISFLKTLTPEEIAQGMQPIWRQHVYQEVNGEELYDDPVDCDKVGDYLYILHGTSQKMIQINAKTMMKQMEYDFGSYQTDFIPTRMMSYDGKFSRDFYVPSRNGGVAAVQTREQYIFPYLELPKDRYTWIDAVDRPSYFSSCEEIYIGRTPGSNVNNVLCWSGANADREIAMRPCYDYFEDKEIINLFMNEKNDGNDVFTFNKQGGQLYITAINSMMYNFSNGTAPWIMFERPLSNAEIIDENTQLLTNDLYSCVFISHENKVYKWFYNQPNEDLPSTPFIELPAGEEIRCINHYVVSRSDEDYQVNSREKQTEIYIATCNPNREGEFKGSLYVYNADTGEQQLKYEGISDEPVDMFYKIK